MKNYLLGILTGLVLCALVLFIGVFAIARLAGTAPSIQSGSTLILRLSGDLPEKAPPEIPLAFLEAQSPMTLPDVWLTLRKAAADPRVRAVVFEPRGLTVGWAKLQELRLELDRFRKSGKPLYAFLRNPGAREYYVASLADRIYLTPLDSLDVKGLQVETLYLKDTLDKVGVKAEVIHAGKYKDAGDMFTRTSMSPETREVLTAVLDQYYGDLLNVISTSRHKSVEEVRKMVDEGPLPAGQALADGLVDQLGFEDALEHDLAARLRQTSLRLASGRVYAKIPASTVPGVEGPKRIALVSAEGMIVRGGSQNDFSDGLIASRSFTRVLRDVASDPGIQGVVLRVDSPGGDGVASDDILQAARALSRKKPVVISMSDYAASGGYFISMTGDPIVAYPNTLTGSIGVIYTRFSMRGLYDKLGIKRDSLSRGRYAGLDSGYNPLTPDEQNKIASQIDSFYQSFLKRVAEGRKLTTADIEPLAQGRVWLGTQARDHGLVNEMGGLDAAIDLVKRRAGIPSSAAITLVSYPRKRSLLDLLMSRGEQESPAIDSIRGHLLSLWAPQADPLALLPADVRAFAPTARLLLGGGLLDLMPYWIEVH